MMKSKKEIVLHGSLLCPLLLGQSAVFYAGGKIYRTSRVIAVYEQSKELVRFETLNSTYNLSMNPFPLAVCNPLPMSLAACA